MDSMASAYLQDEGASMNRLRTTLNAAKLWFFKAVILALSLLPASCHYLFTGPALWSHNSSAAFDAWMFLWLMSLTAIGVAIWFAVTVKE
jgi:hypothetical protein